MKKNTCPVCGKQINQEIGSQGGRPKRFCSPHCRQVYHCRASEARKRGAEVGPDGHPLRPGRKCCVCGKEIDQRKNERAVCCSDVCSMRRNNRLRRGAPVGEEEYRAFIEKRKAERLAKLQRVCPVCGKEFVADAAHLGRKFCSTACSNRARTGSKHAAKPTDKPVAKPTADQAYEASVARVRAYLKLPARARWANRGMLTDTELRMAEQMWENGHGGWNVHYNTIR